MPLNYMETGSLLLSKVSVNRLYFFDRLESRAAEAARLFGIFLTLRLYP